MEPVRLPDTMQQLLTIIIALLAVSWLIDRYAGLHRNISLLFLAVPLMTAAFAMVTWAGAQKAVGGHPFYTLFGQALLTADVWLTLTMAVQVYLALRFRRQVHLHSALMISTLVGLLPPILTAFQLSLRTACIRPLGCSFLLPQS